MVWVDSESLVEIDLPCIVDQEWPDQFVSFRLALAGQLQVLSPQNRPLLQNDGQLTQSLVFLVRLRRTRT